MFLASQVEGASQPQGSQGTLCLGGAIGRFTDDVQFSGAAGAFALQLDLEALAVPGGTVAAQPGETWLFTAWYRDFNPNFTSNCADAIRITFR